MRPQRANLLWYAFTATGMAVLVLLVASVVGPQILSELTPKYKVVFFQTPTCGPDSRLFALPWAVRIGNTTIMKGGSSLPENDSRALRALPDSLLNESRITFSLPSGTYRYSLLPAGDFWDPYTFPQGVASGVVQVSGQDVSVNVTVANPGVCSY